MKVKTEAKVKAASWASFLGSLALLSVLGIMETDYVEPLPDLVEVPVWAALVSLATWVSGYATKHRPASMSDSAVEAVRKRMGEAFAGIKR